MTKPWDELDPEEQAARVFLDNARVHAEVSERRYLGGGTVAHLLYEPGYYPTPCGITVDLDLWLGTGDQDEYDRAAALPLCADCARWLPGAG